MIENDEKLVEAEKQRLANEKILAELRSAHNRLWNTDDGKIVYKDLARFCNKYTSCVCEQSPDALQAFHEAGKRRVILRIDSLKEIIIKERNNE